ncbi:hypothetical protein ZIOFF_070120 [Zingiber officinale]|uniref:Isoamylase 1-3-like C-terminal domain-containing protein n=1 Tax=Zingiber officinale TaxID=94328 RepID=A0A8J5CWH0_ZINOF|nr:hypothetical protein ZIOFF_070120 [Zingiber officinale]
MALIATMYQATETMHGSSGFNNVTDFKGGKVGFAAIDNGDNTIDAIFMKRPVGIATKMLIALPTSSSVEPLALATTSARKSSDVGTERKKEQPEKREEQPDSSANKRKPYHSINFIIAHDGFTLYDLVSYNYKHNNANGEGGNDGCNDNYSWNCGFEGETKDVNVLSLRLRQMKNFHLALMISQGTPMMLMGDEYGHTRYGNNNSYGHDTSINHFQWKLKDVTWHEDNWDNHESKFLAFTLHDDQFGGDIYVAFNAHDYSVKVTVPSPPQNKQWHRVIDTNLESPKDFIPEGILFTNPCYNVAPYSSILLEAKP